MERQPNRNAIYKHVVTAEGEHWKFRRSPAFMAIMFVLFLLGVVISIVLVTHLLGSLVEERVMFAILLLALFPVDLLVISWDTGLWPRSSITLGVDRAGRVCFGKRELCPAGTVRAVCIATRRRKLADWQVYLELEGGNDVLVPPAYFGDFELGEHARPLGEELANALGYRSQSPSESGLFCSEPPNELSKQPAKSIVEGHVLIRPPAHAGDAGLPNKRNAFCFR